MACANRMSWRAYLVRTSTTVRSVFLCRLRFVCPLRRFELRRLEETVMLIEEGGENTEAFDINIYLPFIVSLPRSLSRGGNFLLKDYVITGRIEELIYDREVLSLGGLDQRAYDHHVQRVLMRHQKVGENKNANQPAFH